MREKIVARILLVLFMANIASAYVANTISIQGKLVDSGGSAVTGPVNITVRIWNQSSGGTKQWEENETEISLESGIFNIIVGDNTSFSVPFSDEYKYIEYVVDGETSSSRVEITGVPYALKAAVAEDTTGLDAGNITSGTFDISDRTNLAAGDGITLTDDAVSITPTYFDGIYVNRTQALGGDLGGSLPNPTVSDDSHNHVISNIDNFWAAVDANDTDTDTTYSAGNGLDLSVTTFSVAGNLGLTQDSDGLSITPTYFDGIYVNRTQALGGDVSGTYDAIVVADTGGLHAGNITGGELPDARVVDTITASNYLPLAGGELSGYVNSSSDINTTGKICDTTGCIPVGSPYFIEKPEITSNNSIEEGNVNISGNITVRDSYIQNGVNFLPLERSSVTGVNEANSIQLFSGFTNWSTTHPVFEVEDHWGSTTGRGARFVMNGANRSDDSNDRVLFNYRGIDSTTSNSGKLQINILSGNLEFTPQTYFGPSNDNAVDLGTPSLCLDDVYYYALNDCGSPTEKFKDRKEGLTAIKQLSTAHLTNTTADYYNLMPDEFKGAPGGCGHNVTNMDEVFNAMILSIDEIDEEISQGREETVLNSLQITEIIQRLEYLESELCIKDNTYNFC